VLPYPLPLLPAHLLQHEFSEAATHLSGQKE
jgi:hypothetical protein